MTIMPMTPSLKSCQVVIPSAFAALLWSIVCAPVSAQTDGDSKPPTQVDRPADSEAQNGTGGLASAAAEKLQQQLRKQLADVEEQILAGNDDLGRRSARGDIRFFLGQFSGAVEDYDQMLKFEPKFESSHWRRGIALFYAGKYRQAATQFEKYHSYDNVDRENGIWRYLCQVRAYGEQHAQRDLLKYEKDDREPFPDVYRLFAGKLKPEQLRQRIQEAELARTERRKREFYAELYIGLWQSVHDRNPAAREALHRAVNNTWPQTAGFGPRYMWHVGRVHLELLNAQAKRDLEKAP